jgi:CRISPR-associated protein Csm4
MHIGEAISIDRETVLDWLPSDSLFAALVTAWTQIGVDVNARLAAFTSGAPPFRLTSAFPWVDGIRFLPAPAAFPDSVGLVGKDAKRVQWISSAVYEQLRTSGRAESNKENFLHDGKVWVTTEEKNRLTAKYTNDEGKVRLWQTFVVPRVTIDRATNASNLFHAGRVSFAEGDGLWFVARGTQTEWIDEALHLLQDNGLGGLRNYGHGAFKWHAHADDLPASPSTGAGYLLARYAPNGEKEIQATLQHSRAAYRLVKVGGWCTDDAGQAWRRRMVRLVAEGALIPDVTQARGKLVEVQPDNVPQFAARKVYRYGIPFFLPAERLEVEQ